MSGGFAGFDRTLQLASTGSATAADRKRGIQVMAKATAEEMMEIGSFIPVLKPGDPGRDASCRDCIEYSLEVQRSGGSVALRFNDAGLRNSRVQALVKVLTAVMNRSLVNPSPSR
jgi:hypothetical protein